MRWHEDIRYNRGLKWLRGEDEVIECETIGRETLRWEYSGKTYETNSVNIEDYSIMVKDGWKGSSPWYEEMCRDMNGGIKQITDKELDVSFVSSGVMSLMMNTLNFTKNNVREPKYKAEMEKSMWIWKEPEEGHKYIMGVDVSRGDGKDSSTIVILDFENLEQVAEFKYKLPPDLLAEIVYKYGNLYNAYTVVDITLGGMGVSTVMKLLEMGYDHLHYDDPKSRKLSEKYAKTLYKQGDKVPRF